jgi:Tol biopolymer transport system component
VLDFGLAKTGTRGLASSDESPTITSSRTEAGMILGTAAYMSPEQAKGREVDKRADIWAFGCVFYEMLTGAPPYHGDTTQETMASILRDPPDLDNAPAQARRLLKRCLEKDAQKRLRHIGDVMSLLDEPPSGPVAPAAAVPPDRGAATSPPAPAKRAWLWPAVAAAVVVAAGGAFAVWAPWRAQAPAAEAVRFEVGESDAMKFFYGGAMAISPDGHWLVFPATGSDGVNRYWLRSLDTVEARPLPGTETAYVPPAWSADSRYVLFSPLSSAQIKKVDIQGGPPQVVSEMIGRLNGASANSEGVVIFGSSTATQPLFRASLSGGAAPTPVTALTDGDIGHKYPQFLPGGHHFLYFRSTTDPNTTGVYVGSIDARPGEQRPTRVLATDRQAYYAASSGEGAGRLISLRDTTLMAQPFDPVSFELSGEAVPIAEGVESFASLRYGMFSISDRGALVYRRAAGGRLTVLWFDDRGSPGSALADTGEHRNPALSPDQTRVAVSGGTPGAFEISSIDLGRGTNIRLTFDAANDDNAVWSPDGKYIAFASTRTGQQRMYVKPADGSGEERLLSDQMGVPTSWSSDGRFLVFTTIGAKTGPDIWVLPDPLAATPSKPFPLLATPLGEQMGRLSPDGRWLAYTSGEAFNEVYVRPYVPVEDSGRSGARWLVSRGLAGNPRWRGDSKQLLYVNTSLDVMAVDVDTTNGFQPGTPRRLFTAPAPLLAVGWDLAQDAKRFLFVTTPDGERPSPFTVVINWAAALEK